MLSKNPVKPCLSASSRFIRKPTGSRWMSSMACVTLAMMLASRSLGKFISRRTSEITVSTTTPMNAKMRPIGSPKRSTMRSNARDGLEQVVERRACPRRRGTC